MVLIFITWLYILFTTVNLGFVLDKITGLKNNNLIITSVLGLFLTTVLASIWAIFDRINIEFHVFLLLLNLILIFKFQSPIFEIYKTFLLEFRQLQKTFKIVLILIALLIIAQCAAAPFVLDNESYYIQTIKWINEYGFVKGLANLHLFFGQTSGWHVTQSVFNFSFLYKNFNDLSGYCLLLGNVFSIQKLNEYYKNDNKNYLIIGLFPLCNIFFFQFISAPSPDIAVYVFSFMFFFYFLENFKKTTSEAFHLMVILILFLLYIKNTTLTFALFPILLLLLHYKTLYGQLVKPIVLTVLVLSLFVIKNMIICGLPVFPSNSFNSFTTGYAIPDSIENFYYDQIKYYGFLLKAEQYHSMSFWDLFLRWITMPKLNGLFNKIDVLLIVVVPLFILKFQNKKALWALYIGMVLQSLLLLITSPQYRFFMNFLLYFSLFCLASLTQRKKVIDSLVILSLIPVFAVLFFSLNFSRFSNNPSMKKSSRFSIDNIVFPYKNTKSDTAFVTVQLGNFSYKSPKKSDFFWGNGDGDLPCVNKDQIDYFKKHFNIIPQMRTNDLKDGFYAKKLSKNE